MKSMPWFRFYSETADDVKFKFLSRTLKMPVFSVIGIWAILECRASQSPKRGYLYVTTTKRYTVDDIADELNIDPETCGAIIDAFCEMEMLDVQSGVIHLTNWEKRQYASDNSTERVNRFREKKAAGGDCNVSETLPVTVDSVSVSESVSESELNIFRVYEQNIGPLTPKISERLLEIENKHPAIWFDEAVEIACENNARNIAYISAILDRWSVDGFKSDMRPKDNGKRNGRPTIAQNIDKLSAWVAQKEKEALNGNA